MTKRIGGERRKTRDIYKKHIKTKGKLPITKFLTEFSPGEKVVLKVEPGYQKGTYFRRFHGKHGEVLKKIGYCYEVQIRDGGKMKKVIVHPVHLQQVKKA
ncbi:MAG: 50S ribosomal protein L21e [Nanoarchaeota archaeon]